MGSINKCIKSLGKSLSEQDAAEIKQSLNDYLDEGMSADKARNAAVNDAINRAIEEFDQLIALVNDQTGVKLEMQRPEAARSADDEPMKETIKFLRELRKNDYVFQNKLIDSKDLEEILRTNLGDKITYFADVTDALRGQGDRFEAYSIDIAGRDLENPGEDGVPPVVERNALVTVEDGVVVLNISGFTRGSGGSAIYDAVAQFAYNNGYVFVEDPQGLSDDALPRRLENMLSSAIKMGTTRHIAPGDRQSRGSDAVGIEPLEWKQGDDDFNIASMIRTLDAFYRSKYPELDDLSYDFQLGIYRDSDGSELSPARLRAVVDAAASRNTRAGVSSVKRILVTRSLAREASSDRGRKLLQEAARELSAGKRAPAFAEIYYSRGQVGGGRARAAVSAAVKATIQAMRAAGARAAAKAGKAAGNAAVQQGQAAAKATAQRRQTNQAAAARKAAQTKINQLGAMGYPSSGAAPWLLDSAEGMAVNATIGDIAKSAGGFVRMMWNGKTMGEALKVARRTFQDRMIAVREIQSDIEKSGGVVDELNDVYTLENLMHGRIGDQMREADRKMLEPLRDAIAAGDLTTAELESYLYAKHAPVRNARILKIDPSNAEGSGMSDAEAAQIMAGFTPEKLAALAAAEVHVRAMIDATRKRMLDAGLITQEVYDALAADDTYVPLRGQEGGQAAGEDRLTNTGQGLDTRGNEVMRALGRMTKATNIVGEIIGDMHRSIIRSEKNRVGQSLLRLALQNPNERVWKVEQVKTERRLSDKTGLIYDAVVDDKWDDATFFVKADGKPYKLTLKHAGLARSMKNLGVEQTGAIVRYLGKASRIMSTLYTSANPNFALVNPLRDILQAAMITGADKIPSREILGMWAKARSAVRSDIRGTPGRLSKSVFKDAAEQAQWAGYAREFSAAGATTGFTSSMSIDEHVEKMERDLERKRKGGLSQLKKAVTLQGGKQTGEMIWESGLRAGEGMLDWIDHVNEANENATRLAVYVALRRNGWSVQRSAAYVKNITVNFNRRGEAASSMNAWFLFFNAAMQGAHTLVRAMKNPTFQKMMGGLYVAQLSLALAQAWDEDDDGEYQLDKVDPYAKERSLILWVGSDGEKLTFPLPYGISYAAMLGTTTAEIIRDLATPGKASKGPLERAADLTAGLVNSFLPVRIEQPGMMLSPDVLDPIVELGVNEDNFGRVIRPEGGFEDFESPRADRYWPGTSDVWVNSAWALSRATGGDFVSPGLIDLSPNDIQHLFEQYTGGPGKLLFTDLPQFFENMWDGKVGDSAKSIPVFKQVYGGGNKERATNALFKEHKAAIAKRISEVKIELKNGRDPSALMREHPVELNGAMFMPQADGGVRAVFAPGSVGHALRQSERMLELVNQEITALQDSDEVQPSEKRKRLDALFEYKESVQRQFNTFYNARSDAILGRN